MMRAALATAAAFVVAFAILVFGYRVDAETAADLLHYAEMSNHIYHKGGCTRHDCHEADLRRPAKAHVLVLNWEEILNKPVSAAQTTINHRLLRADNRGKLLDADISDTGFNAALYRHNTTGRYTLVFEGTSSFEYKVKGRRSSDFEHANAANSIPFQTGAITHYEIAKALVFTLREMGLQPYDITGHSLGGSLAQYASVLSGNRAVVFNSAAVNCGQVDCTGADHSKITRVDTVGLDLANAMTTLGSMFKGQQLGQFLFAGFGSHDMSEVVIALRTRTVAAR